MTEESSRLTIADNISRYRKSIGLTQSELSEKINYSDKSVSKWERGEGVPDAATLIRLSEIFGVTVNDLVYPQADSGSESRPEKQTPSNSTADRFTWKHYFITLLSVGTAWLVAFLTACIFEFVAPDIAEVWNERILCYAGAAGSTVWLVLAVLWWPFAWRLICVTVLTWTAALSVYVTFPITGAGWVFAVAAVGQMLITVCYIWKCVTERKILKLRFFPQKR